MGTGLGECRDRISYQGRQVAVLGASGFIGRWVARALAARGARVALIVRDANALVRVGLRHIEGAAVHMADAGDAAAICKILARLRPVTVFNLIGYGVDPAERDEVAAQLVNTELLQTLVEAVRLARDPAWPGQHLVHTGSALEYGPLGTRLDEDSPAMPTTLYGKTKLAGTQMLSRLCRHCGIRGLTARLFTVYGPGEHSGRLLPSLLQAARSGAPLDLTEGRQMRDFTYVADVAEGLIRLGLSSAAPGTIVNLATGRLTSVRDFVETAALELGVPAEQLCFGSLATRPEEMHHQEVALERLRALTGWTCPTTVREGIRRTAQFAESVPRSA